MSKTIKFNLTLDKHPVRDLDDLREHFNIDDLLEVYHNQVLHRWLSVRGLLNELNSLTSINSSNNKTIAVELCKIFHVDIAQTDIDAAVYPFNARQQQYLQLKELANYNFSRDVVIDEYHSGYKQLCNDMIENAENYQFLKVAVDNLWKNYSQLLMINFEELFLSCSKYPLISFTMLANDKYRQSSLFDDEYKDIIFSSTRLINSENLYNISTFKENTNNLWVNVSEKPVYINSATNSSNALKIKDKYEKVHYLRTTAIVDGLNVLSAHHLDSVSYIELPAYYRFFSGVTDGYWKDIVPKGKKCLVLRIEEGNFVRNAGTHGEELNAKAVNGNFLILDGIDYKSNNADHTLLYMVI